MKFSSLDQSILAHFSPGFGGTELPEWLIPYLDNGLGGVTLFSSNTPSLETAAKLVENIRSINPDVIITIDEEGGDVTRLFVTEGSPFATPALLGRCDNSSLTNESYFELGKILKSIGIDMNLAPVADVSVEIENPIVGVRSFGSDYELTSRHVRSAIQGLNRSGIAACIKHFPGHGGVVEDSHHNLPKLHGSLIELESTHIKPFSDSIKSGVDAVMTGHIVIPALDPSNPASCSKIATREYLREKLNFGGLVVTDALDMGALGGPKKIHVSALRALKAGADLLCFSGLYDQSSFVENSLQAIKSAALSDEVSAELIATNATKIRNWRPPKPKESSAQNLLDIERFSSGVAVQGNVLLKSKQLQLIEMSADPTIAAGFVGWGLRRTLINAGKKVKLESSDIDLGSAAEGQVVVAFRDAFRDSKLLVALERINKARPDAIFVDMGWPTLKFNPTNLIRTYGSSALASEIATQLMTNPVN